MSALPNIFRVGEYTIERNLNSISRHGSRQIVAPKVMALLYYLSCHANEVISREQLLDDVWQSTVSDGAVNRVIGLLRKALGDDAESPCYIQTVAKKGYRLIAMVSPMDKVITIEEASHNELGLSKQKRKIWLLLLKIVALFSIILSLFLILQPLRPTVKQSLVITTPQFEQLTSEQGFEYDASLSKDEKWLVYRHKKKLNQPYHLYLKKRDQQQTIQLTNAEYNDRSPAFSHDKSKIIFFRKGNNTCHINVLNLDVNGQALGIEELYQCGAIEHYSNVVWAPDDLSVYFTDRNNSSVPYQIYQLHLSTRKVDEITHKEDNYYGDNELSLSPNGEQLLFFRNKYWGNNQVFVKNLLTGEQTKITELGFLSWTPSWTLDGKSILFSDNRNGGKLKLLALETGDIQTLYQSAQAINSPQLSASGKHIIYSTQTADIDLWQLDLDLNKLDSNELGLHDLSANMSLHTLPAQITTPKLSLSAIKLPVNSSRMDSQPVYSKDGSTLLFLSNRNGVMQLWLQKSEGVKPLDSLVSAEKIESYAWHPDGINAVVALSDKRLYLVNTEKNNSREVMLNGQSAAYPNFSPDGSTLYFSSDKSSDWQIWAYNFQDQSINQITNKGGYQAISAITNGKLYFTKYRQRGIWQYDLATKEETKIINDVSRNSNFKVCSDSIYFLLEKDNIELWQMNVSTAEIHKVMTSALNSRFKFDMVNDCQQLVFSKWENVESDIMMLNL